MKPTLRELTGIFFRIGNTTFGGGLPTIAALQRELVEKRKWLSHEDYGLAFALSRITPGTNVIAFCAAAGARIMGFPGALSGALAETVPSAVLAILITQGYESWRSHPVVMAAMSGTIAAVAGMMWSSVWALVRPYTKGIRATLRATVFTGGAFVAIWKFEWTPLTIIVLAMLLGFLWPESPKERPAK